MKTVIKLLLATAVCSLASIKAMNNDQELERALALSRQTAREDQERRALTQALSESERSYKREQERRAAEEKKKKEEEAELQRRAQESLERFKIKFKLNQDLIDACTDGRTERAKELLLKGADLEAVRNNGSVTPLYAAVNGAYHAQGFDVENYHNLIRYLIGQGANINARHSVGSTVLMAAVYSAPAIFKTILDQNPDISIVNAQNQTIFDILRDDLRVAYHEEKLKMLEVHLAKIANENKSKIENTARPVLVAVTNNGITNLIMDYIGNGSYPLSDEIQVPFTPKVKSQQNAAEFIVPDGQ